MKFVKLTILNPNEPIWINVNCITSIREMEWRGQNQSLIFLHDIKMPLEVEQSPEQIMELIKKP